MDEVSGTRNCSRGTARRRAKDVLDVFDGEHDAANASAADRKNKGHFLTRSKPAAHRVAGQVARSAVDWPEGSGPGGPQHYQERGSAGWADSDPDVRPETNREYMRELRKRQKAGYRMPTRPVFELHPRTTESNVQSVLDRLADSLDEVVNFGTHVIDWHSEATAGGQDEQIPVALLLRHILELIDAISILVRSFCVEPSHTTLRSTFEAAVYLNWILRDDRERRAMAFLVWHQQQKLKWIDRLDESTQQGKQLASTLEGTAFDEIDTARKFDLDAMRDSIQTVLSSPRYREAAAEYHKVRSENRRRTPAWYQLFGGPSTLQQLSKRVRMAEWYEILYERWSGVTHATEIVTGKIVNAGVHSEITQIRSPLGVESVFTFAVPLALKTYTLWMSTYDPSKLDRVRRWYIDEIQAIYTRAAESTWIVEK